MPSMVTATSSPTQGADPCGGAREDHIAREQRHGLRDVDDQVLDGADHVAGAAELSLLAVDRRLDGEVVGVHVGLHPGSQRAGGVEALGTGPLLLALLHIAGGDVVGAGVAEDDVLDALAGDLAAHAADDHGQLGLVVQVVREGGVLDRVAGADHRGGGLEEGDRRVGDLVAEFGGVLRVVAADGHDLVGEHGGSSRTLFSGTLVPESSKSAYGMPLMMSRTRSPDSTVPCPSTAPKATLPSMENLAMRTGCCRPSLAG